MFTHHRSIRFILLLLCIFDLSPPALSIRKDASLLPKHICRTTVQGRYYLTDDNGYVCDAFSVDPLTRCCPGRGDKFSCQGCNVVSQCCNSYEFCVSCCLNPDMTHKGLALKVKIAKPMSAGMYGTVFDYCAGRCRHNSESVDLLVHNSKQDLLASMSLLEDKGNLAILSASLMDSLVYPTSLHYLISAMSLKNI